MPEEKARKLWNSDKVLVHPDGSNEIKVLENILYDATLEKLDKTELIVTTHEQRVKNFDFDNPEWEKIEYNVPLQSLFDLYKELNGRDYKQPTYDEISRNRLEFKC